MSVVPALRRILADAGAFRITMDEGGYVRYSVNGVNVPADVYRNCMATAMHRPPKGRDET